MTKVEKEVLEALSRLGRRSWQHPYDVTRMRLHIKYQRKGSWKKIPDFIARQTFAQYETITLLKLHRLERAGYAEREYSSLRAGKTLNLVIGPLFKVTAEGRAKLKEI